MDKIGEIKKDIKKYGAIAAIANTDGGKILISSLKKDIISSINELTSGYKILSHIEIIAICARLSERLAVLKTINNSTNNKKFAQEALEFILQNE